ncbi:MAG: hypothetical protein NZM04_10645 [Methylacidiphilales bacterium]|nr:hypothetical protein [Candidatus Methylacidiphilales bacterium]MDW8349081.1 hypothetical protein [Verrucomicrobiae bacterium]
MKSLIKSIILIPIISSFIGCATTEKNTENKRVSTVPWNKPQRWEGYGQMGAVADAMGAGRPGGY